MVAAKRAREFRGVEARRAEEEMEIVGALQRQNGVSTVEKLATILWSQGEELRQELAASCCREAALRRAVLSTLAQQQAATARATAADGRAQAAEAERDAVQAAQASVLRNHGARLQEEVADLRERLAVAEAAVAEMEAAQAALASEAEQRVRELTTRLTLSEHATCAALERARVAETQRDEARALQNVADRELAKLRKPRRLTPPSPPAPVPAPPRPMEIGKEATAVEVRLWVRQTRSLSALHGVSAERWEADDAAPLRRQVYRLMQQAPGAGRAAMAERALELARALGGA